MTNHRQAHNDLIEFSTCIQCAVPWREKRVEYLNDSTIYTDITLQSEVILIRVNSNNMREDFESASSAFIEVYLYYRSSISTGHNDDVYSIDFKYGCGSSGVELRYHPREEFQNLSKD